MRTLQKAALAAAAAGLVAAARKPRTKPQAAPEPEVTVPAQRGTLLGLDDEDSLLADQDALDGWLNAYVATLT